MKPIPNAYKKVPMMFRAQILGRSQLHYIDPQKKKDGEKQDVQYWAEEWMEKAEFIPLTHSDDSQNPTDQTKTYQIRWRFVTNGGQDDGMIRPVIGGYGIPFYPGSSMKGAFRQACEQAEQAGIIPPNRCNLYCGDETNFTPGLLRFHGAYPINDWTKNLVDLVHPQQGWQVKTQNTRGKNQLSGESAYALVSLVQPTLRFGISSRKPLSTEQWQEIWQIWQYAIATGLGTRVSAGYGQVETDSRSILYQVRVKGQGQAAKLIDGTGEFRPNIFRASLRGHALRLFGGLTNAKTAEALVEQLFGGVEGNGSVGLLKLGFQTEELRLGTFGRNEYEQPTYNVEGDIIWSLTRPLPDDQHAALQNLVTDLIWFAMVFGGFGKSWRRADHRLFYDDDEYEKLIGCHWQWAGKIDQKNAFRVRSPKTIGKFINSVLDTAKTWMKLQGKIPNPNHPANWRESWHPSRVQVWGRLAKNRDECVAIYWLHKRYQEGIRRGETDKSIKRTSVTGELGQIGRLWHRMYPPKLFWIKKEGKLEPKSMNRFIELLTLFPDESPECKKFVAFLQQKPKGFELLWGGKE
ncbi:MAG: RAMP superfamily protein [Coleofasciculus sp. B1-GNL1-01]|uniref:RAMP superfamily CRISPR-associated protein n=1 Tax=Coleofasciculus sp. B1-GNL1-01 TaxID=3068484 RepID=UPI0032F223BD